MTDTVYLDDLPMKVTLNLFCALKYLRHTSNIGEDLLLWIDALVSSESSSPHRHKFGLEEEAGVILEYLKAPCMLHI